MKVSARIRKKRFRKIVEGIADLHPEVFGNKPNQTRFINGMCWAWHQNMKRKARRCNYG